MKKWLRRLLRTLAIMAVLVNVMAFFHARKFTHFDPGTTRAADPYKVTFFQKLGILFTGVTLPRPVTKKLPVRPYETIYVSGEQKIACWQMKVQPAKGTVILFHGYGGEKSDMLDRAYVLAAAGYNVLLPDFRGAGASEGNECTIGYKEANDVKACVSFLQQQGEKSIYLLGASMGAAAVMKACSREALPVKALVLECPFASMRQTVKNRFEMVGVPSFPLADLLVFWGGTQNSFNAFAHNPEDYARQINIPVLLLYGKKDDRVKPFEITQIYRNLAGPKTLIEYPLAGHESYLNHYREQWTQDVLRFLNEQAAN